METIDAKLILFVLAMCVTIVSSDMLDDFSLLVKMWIFVGVCLTLGRVSSFVGACAENDNIAFSVSVIAIVIYFKAAFVMVGGIFADADRFKFEVGMWTIMVVKTFLGMRKIAMQGA